MFQQFLDNNAFINGSTTPIEDPPHKRTSKAVSHNSSEGETSDEETYFEQYFEERPQHQDVLDEIYSKMIEEEGRPKFELEAAQQQQLANLQARVVQLEFEHQGLKRMNHDLKSRQHKNKLALDDQKRDREIMEKIRSNLAGKLSKLEDKGRQQNILINQLKKQMNTSVDDLQESATKRVNNLVKINDKVEIMTAKPPQHETSKLVSPKDAIKGSSLKQQKQGSNKSLKPKK